MATSFAHTSGPQVAGEAGRQPAAQCVRLSSAKATFSGAFTSNRLDARPAARIGIAGRRGAQTTVAVFKGLGNIFSSDPSAKTRAKYQDRVDAITALEPAMQALTNEQLRAKTAEFKQRVAAGASVDDLLVEAFAVSTTLHNEF